MTLSLDTLLKFANSLATSLDEYTQTTPIDVNDSFTWLAARCANEFVSSSENHYVMHDWWTFQNLYHGPLVEPITEVAKPYGDFCSDFQAAVDTYNSYLIQNAQKKYHITASLQPSDFVYVLDALINCCSSSRSLAKEAFINVAKRNGGTLLQEYLEYKFTKTKALGWSYPQSRVTE